MQIALSGLNFNIVPMQQVGEACNEGVDFSKGFLNILSTMIGNVAQNTDQKAQISTDADIMQQMSEAIKALFGDGEKSEQLLNIFANIKQEEITQVNEILQNLQAITQLIDNNEQQSQKEVQKSMRADTKLEKPKDQRLMQVVAEIVQQVAVIFYKGDNFTFQNSNAVSGVNSSMINSVQKISNLNDNQALLKDIATSLKSVIQQYKAQSLQNASQGNSNINDNQALSKDITTSLKNVFEQIKAQPMQDFKLIQNDFKEGQKSINEAPNIKDIKEQLSAESSKIVKPVKESNIKELENILSAASMVSNKDVQVNSKTLDNYDYDLKDIETQIKTQIVNQIVETKESGESKKLIFTLNPEKLGKVGVIIEKSSDNIVVRIMAKEAATQKLLSQSVQSLSVSLAQSNSQIKQVLLVDQPEKASMFFGSGMENNFDMSSNSQFFSGSSQEFKENNHRNSFYSEKAMADKSQNENIIERGKGFWQTA